MAEKLDIHGKTRRQGRGGRGDRIRGGVRAFTLIELLVVIALTGLLLALVLGPLIQGFRLTNRARAFATAQDATRFTMEQLRRELQQASYVFDNTNTPIILPLDNPRKLLRDKSYYPGGNARPSILYALIDFVPTATQGVGAKGTVIDPTTNRPMGGSPLSLPVAPGQRYVRYFIGLRYNLAAADGTPAFYRNTYEFPRTDSGGGGQDFNSFVLYRAEYDPRDANLINQDENTNPYQVDGGGLHDPDFFYNLNAARNGKSYAENWRAASSPVLSSPNLDLLIWRRDIGRQIDTNTPFQLAVQLTPSTVLSDALTPGFISNTAAETPGAVPSLYTAQYGQWTYPFTITVYRASTQYNPSRPRPSEPYSSVSFTIGPNGPDQRLQVTVPAAAAGAPFKDVNANARQNYFWLLDSQTGKIFIYTANLAFLLDPARGRIETAFSPLATDPSGVPLYVDAVTGSQQVLKAGRDGNFGTLVPTIFRQQTLDQANAGRQIDPTAQGTYFVPLNQGILGADLSAASYYLATAPLPDFTTPGTQYNSPFVTFGGALNNPTDTFRGIMIVPGSEKVMGPDNNVTVDKVSDPNKPIPVLVDYYRISAVTSAPKQLAKSAAINGDANNPLRLYTRTAQLNYDLEFDLDNYRAPKLLFDEPGDKLDDAAGLPALAANNADAAIANELRVSYLWQNNYSRNTAGQPLNADGNTTIGNLDDPLVRQTNPLTGVIQSVLKNPTGSAVRPEADVIRADYSTRSLMNIVMGARVYDSTTGTPQTAQITDKIVINNIPR